MPTKIFTTIEQECPFGRGCKIDSTTCRACPDYFRMGTGFFFWCRKENPEPVVKKKVGRPRKDKKKPVKKPKDGKR